MNKIFKISKSASYLFSVLSMIALILLVSISDKGSVEDAVRVAIKSLFTFGMFLVLAVLTNNIFCSLEKLYSVSVVIMYYIYEFYLCCSEDTNRPIKVMCVKRVYNSARMHFEDKHPSIVKYLHAELPMKEETDRV